MSFLSFGGLSAIWQAVAIGAGAAAVGALVAMYFLKLKRVRCEVASTFLWRKSVQDLHANSPFQRLRRNLLLFLQLLILLAALAALARPALRYLGGKAVTYILLVDNSASMSAVEEASTRLEEAKGHAHALISDMRAVDSMMVLSFASRPRVVATLTNDQKALEAAVESIAPTQQRTDVESPLELAGSLTSDLENPRIFVISDGAFASGMGGEGVAAPVEYIGVGTAAANVGVTALDMRRDIENPYVGEIFAKVTNFSSESMIANVALEVDGTLLDAQRVEIGPGQSHAAVFRVSLESEMIASVSVDCDDALSADNRAWVMLEPPKDIEVYVASGADAFLMRSIRASGRFKIREMAQAEGLALTEGASPVFVYGGRAPDTLVKGGYLVFNAAVAADGFAIEGTAQNPIVLDVDNTHPATTYLTLDDLFITEALKMSFPAETKVLVDSDQGPLVAISYVGEARVLTVAFDPMNSRWPLRISYPMFVTNAINFLASGGEGAATRSVKTGDVLMMPAGDEPGTLVVKAPSGRIARLAHNGEGSVAYGETLECGVYTVESDGGSVSYVANLVDGNESDIRPRASFEIGSSEVEAQESPSRKNREIWRELLLLACVVLLVEWYIYNRRVYI